MNDKRLGKGLDRLLDDEDIESAAASESDDGRDPTGERLKDIPINAISVNPYQPRQQISEEELDGLIRSIEKEGVLQPVLVRRVDDENYTLAAGERRYRAAIEAGLERIPAVIKQLSDQRMLEIALVENVQREDLNPIEEARALERLFDEFDLDLEQISSMVGLSRAAISNRRRLLNLDEKIQAMVEKGALSGGHARTLLSLSDPDRQFEVAKRIVRKDLSVRNTEKLVRDMKGDTNDTDAPPTPEDELPPELKSIQNSLEERIGTRVQIKTRKNGGEIQIKYGSNDELDAILDRIGVHPPH